MEFSHFDEQGNVVMVDVSGKEITKRTATALPTIYDMCKAIDKRMLISDVHLVVKEGGKSGTFVY